MRFLVPLLQAGRPPNSKRRFLMGCGVFSFRLKSRYSADQQVKEKAPDLAVGALFKP
jgi:hypothetical protein